jgi:hypothetical protein
VWRNRCGVAGVLWPVCGDVGRPLRGVASMGCGRCVVLPNVGCGCGRHEVWIGRVG